MGFLIFALLAIPIVNEVMYNPAGPEGGANSPGDRNEFVEILNRGESPLSLSGYWISDNSEVDSLMPYGDTTLLRFAPGAVINSSSVPPGGYALILDPEYVESCTLNPQPYLIPEGTVILRPHDSDIGNGLSLSDRLYLIDRSGDTVDSYPGDIEAPDGYSVERRDPDGPPEPNNWRISTCGATPGAENSMSRRVAFSIDRKTLMSSPEDPQPGDEITISFSIYNEGLEPLLYGKAEACVESDTVSSLFESPIAPDDTAEIVITLGKLAEGYYEILIRITARGETDSATAFVLKTVRVGLGPVLINEIMYDDSCEWVEIMNRGSRDFDLTGITLRDMSGKTSDPAPSHILAPGELAVFTSCPAFIIGKYGMADCADSLGDLPSLNNSHEILYLIDSTGTVLDKVKYRGSWGGGKGTSLERFSPEVSSSVKSNWSSSTDSSGATPCRRNSISSCGSGKGLLSFSGKYLSLSSGKPLAIYYSLPGGPSRARILIFDSIGRRVRDLWTGESPTGKGVVLFDGKDDRGTPLPSGLYIVYFEGKTKGKLYRNKKALVIRR